MGVIKMSYGQWHDYGGRYRIRLGRSLNYDQGGYHTRVPVQIMDTRTGKVEERVGDGRQIGNFHPVWINWRGKKIQVEKLLDVKS